MEELVELHKSDFESFTTSEYSPDFHMSCYFFGAKTLLCQCFESCLFAILAEILDFFHDLEKSFTILLAAFQIMEETLKNRNPNKNIVLKKCKIALRLKRTLNVGKKNYFFGKDFYTRRILR